MLLAICEKKLAIFASTGNYFRPWTVVRDLGVLIDGELPLRQHVTQLSETCFTACTVVQAVV